MAERAPVRYRSNDEDSARWIGFPFRSGDIVISTRSKSGTTWVQMICALLIFQTAELPKPLWELSPWLDWLVTPQRDVYDLLSAQTHRRVIKTHTPLDGLPLDPRATYIVVGRHPLDMAVSLYHQSDNLDRELVNRLTGQPASANAASERPPMLEWLRSWIDWDGSPHEQLDSLPGVLWHLTDAWARRNDTNLVLVHYDDLLADLAGQMHRLADELDITVADNTWPDLERAATFEHMQQQAERVVPDPVGVLIDKTAFFRRGRSGAAREVLTDDEIAHYHSRANAMAPPDLLAWLHRRELRSAAR